MTTSHSIAQSIPEHKNTDATRTTADLRDLFQALLRECRNEQRLSLDEYNRALLLFNRDLSALTSTAEQIRLIGQWSADVALLCSLREPFQQGEPGSC